MKIQIALLIAAVLASGRDSSTNSYGAVAHYNYVAVAQCRWWGVKSCDEPSNILRSYGFSPDRGVNSRDRAACRSSLG